MKIRSVGAELFLRTDGQNGGQTGMMKLIAAFRNFANEAKNLNVSVGHTTVKSLQNTACNLTETA